MEYFAFQWHITEACDQRCKHCYIYALGSHAKFKEMALDDMVTVNENCKTFCAKADRLPYLYITGGDPILHQQFWTLMKILKLSNIPLLIDEVVKNKADIFAFARYCPPKEDWDTCCSPEEYHDVMEKCWQKFQKYEAEGCETIFNLKDHLWTLFQYEKGIFNPKEYPDDEYVYDGSNCGNCHLTILSDGAVYLCRRMESKTGNALTNDLYDLFTGPAFGKYRIYENFEKCSKCELLRFCRGCPAVAAGYHGNMYAPDPQCWKEIFS